MKIIWSNDAVGDLENIYAHIAQDSPENAALVINEIKNKSKNLSIFPHLGVEGRVRGTRELYISKYPYFAVYRVSSSEVYISAIFRGSQNYK